MGTLSLRYSERLAMRFGARATLLPGLVLIAAGLALFTRAPVDGSYLTDVLPTMILMGTGVGATLAATRTGGLLAHGDSAAAALTGGARLAFVIGAALLVAAVAVAVTVLRPERQAAEEPEDECDCAEAA
jgi:fucose permease